MGWLDDDQILDEACGIYPALDASVVLDEVRACSTNHANDENTWTTPTDADRLQQAFGQLATHGYIPGWNLGRTWREAVAEIEALADGEYAKARRYVVFPDPELENAVTHGSLRLGYGDLDDDAAEAALAAGSDVLATLMAAGLRATWTGTRDAYIRVAVDWRARRGERRIADLALEA
jgi:hypothetical protein